MTFVIYRHPVTVTDLFYDFVSILLLSSKIQNAIKLENISNLITSRLVINVYVGKQGECILLFMADTYQWNVCVRTGHPQM